MNNVVLGNKYFRHLDDDSVETVRVIGFIDNETVRIKFLKDNTKAKIKIDELLKYYFKLNEDGTIITSNLKIIVDDKHNFFDVAVTLYKHSDLVTDPKSLPYIICRQNISDVFTNMQNTNGIQYMGCCISKDTVPEGVPYDGLLMCDDIEEHVVVNMYMTDTLDDILECIKTKPFDRVLNELFEQSIKKFEPKDQEGLRKVKCNCGYVTNLKDLLSLNNFVLDMNAAFGIIKVDLDFDINNNQLNLYQIQLIEQVFNTQFTNHYIVKYDRDIDLASIKNGRYILLKDKHDTTYILSYVSDFEINTLDIAYDKLMALTKENVRVKYNI